MKEFLRWILLLDEVFKSPKKKQSKHTIVPILKISFLYNWALQKKKKKKLQKGTEKDKDEGGALGKFEGVSHSWGRQVWQL